MNAAIININLGVPKNAQIANNLWLFYSYSVNYDAHVRSYPGQNIWRINWATLVSRNPHVAVVNPMMKIWASSNWAFPVTKLYSIAQEVWTSDVQRARRGALTAYGKMMIIPQMISVATPPGEDSEAFMYLQRSNPQYESTQIDWFVYEWGRPALLAESIVGTETRYGYNCTRMFSDRGSFEVLVNKDLTYDKKLSHLFLFLHYFGVIFAVALLIILPFISPFSAFAYLKPFIAFASLSYLFLEAINSNNFVRHWRQTGSFWVALAFAVRDIIIALPFYVFLLPFFLRGVWLAANEIFSFIRTQKDALLQKFSNQERWEHKDNGIMLFRYRNERGIPLNGLLGIAGIAGWIVAFFFI